MKKFLITGFVLLLTSFTCFAQDHGSAPPATTRPSATVPADSWVTLVPTQGRFSVLFPEQAKDQSQTTDSTHGPYTTHLFLAKTTKGLFLVGWVDYDPNFNFGVQSELEANRDNFVKGVKATLVNSSKITFNGYPGLEFTAETDDVVYKSRVYIIGRRPYQLIAGTYKGQDDDYNVSRFLTSFQLKQ
jgi:hypothetical protein